ncbi:DUF3197 domain-containing protein [Deinococcus sp. MIMF12]|uniref:DUF3197 domain-containing protein n=1 Tax=Deinococcus rhizophilus TaxID=3049544 RepID=A0ABT7JFC7_9DEIO|nr:DUF3197 domain-containing protein [Deinococcus rhizophilus]MDL2342638.1 DUF3197 domain-containing protein [Deinococcus rhizophilus]
MNVLEPLGLPGAPLETHRELMGLLGEAGSRWGAGGPATLYLIADWQGVRDASRYAAVLTRGEEAVVTAPAYGPGYGPAGAEALAELVGWTQAQGWPVRETVLNPSDFVRVLAEPDAGEIARLIAASNPSDPRIYTALPRPQPGEWPGDENPVTATRG